MRYCVNRDCDRFAIGKDGFCFDCSQPGVRYTCVIIDKNPPSMSQEELDYLNNGLDDLFSLRQFIKGLFNGR